MRSRKPCNSLYRGCLLLGEIGEIFHSHFALKGQDINSLMPTDPDVRQQVVCNTIGVDDIFPHIQKSFTCILRLSVASEGQVHWNGLAFICRPKQVCGASNLNLQFMQLLKFFGPRNRSGFGLSYRSIIRHEWMKVDSEHKYTHKCCNQTDIHSSAFIKTSYKGSFC